jgi:hypothetical protein
MNRLYYREKIEGEKSGAFKAIGWFCRKCHKVVLEA